jgi:predicted CoA-binding protein
VGPIVEEALARWPGLRTVWMQIGVVNEAAATAARARGVQVVMNRCPKQDYQRLFGELRRAGLNTGVISSRL